MRKDSVCRISVGKFPEFSLTREVSSDASVDTSYDHADEGINVCNSYTAVLLAEMAAEYVKTGETKYVHSGAFSDFECSMWELFAQVMRSHYGKGEINEVR